MKNRWLTNRESDTALLLALVWGAVLYVWHLQDLALWIGNILFGSAIVICLRCPAPQAP
jgi:hypothetical protein